MSRYISYTLLVSAAVLAAACSNSEDMIGNELAGNESSNTPFSILGTSGGTVVNTDASYGEYTAYINVPGKWSVATTKGLASVYPSSGIGPAKAIVQVGENWGSVRENVLTLTAQETAMRANGESQQNLSIVQASSPSLDSISTVFSSNKGAGYSYMPGGEYCDGAMIQLFNLYTLASMQKAKGVRLISDDIFPQTTQEVVTANSEEEIKNGLMVGASIGMDFSKVKSKAGNGGSGSGSIGVDVGKSSERKSKNKYALKRVKTTQFTLRRVTPPASISSATGSWVRLVRVSSASQSWAPCSTIRSVSTAHCSATHWASRLHSKRNSRLR